MPLRHSVPFLPNQPVGLAFQQGVVSTIPWTEMPQGLTRWLSLLDDYSANGMPQVTVCFRQRLDPLFHGLDCRYVIQAASRAFSVPAIMSTKSIPGQAVVVQQSGIKPSSPSISALCLTHFHTCQGEAEKEEQAKD